MTAVTRDKEFYMTVITFKVEDVLFRVSADEFKGNSEVFRDMFSIPPVRKGEVVQEGSSDWNPIVLEGVKADDFRALLRHLYAKKYTQTKPLTDSEWIGIHALAHMWGVDETRKEGKEIIFNMHDSVTKFELGMRFDYDDWIRKAYEELCTRPESLSIDEAKRIGLEAAMHISRLRELRCKSMASAKLVTTLGSPAFGYTHEQDAPRSRPHRSRTIKVRLPVPASVPGPAPFTFGPSCRTEGFETSSRTYSCQSSKVTLYEESSSAAERISKEISDEILKLIPPKTGRLVETI